MQNLPQHPVLQDVKTKRGGVNHLFSTSYNKILNYCCAVAAFCLLTAFFVQFFNSHKFHIKFLER
jgi:hypothetical protein